MVQISKIILQETHPYRPIHFVEFPEQPLPLLASLMTKIKILWISVRRQHLSLVTALLQQQISEQPIGRRNCIVISSILCLQLINRAIVLIVRQLDDQSIFSGYAYSFTQEPENIHIMRKWEGDDPGINNQKTPTILLLTPNKVGTKICNKRYFHTYISFYMAHMNHWIKRPFFI